MRKSAAEQKQSPVSKKQLAIFVLKEKQMIVFQKQSIIFSLTVQVSLYKPERNAFLEKKKKKIILQSLKIIF